MAQIKPPFHFTLIALLLLTATPTAADSFSFPFSGYRSAISLSQTLLTLTWLLNVFRKSGPLKEVIESVRREVIEGNLLRDCLELGSNDLIGLIQIVNDLISQLCSSSSRDSEL